MEAEYKNIIVKVTPDQTLSKVVERLNEIKAEDLRTLGEHVRPNLHAILETAQSFIKMIDGDANA